MKPLDEQVWQEYCEGLLFPSLEELDRYHQTMAEMEAQAADIEVERAYERHLEDRGWYEHELQRQVEDQRGVIQFEDALAASITRKTGMEYQTI